ncbi:MAG: biopolymer transporter ExbD [Polyangiaceae bacterium]|nr:biopolymer transporter ExbD [Polyangiaceae bacterium]
MAIHEPGRRLMQAVPLKFVQKKISGGGQRATNASLSLTSMIDFLVVTVVFLLMTFNASGETPLDKRIKLPKAQNTMDMVDAPMVAISGSTILVNGTPLTGSTRDIEDNKRMQRIDELFNALSRRKDQWTRVTPNKPFPGVVILQIDQDVPAVVVKSVFQTAAFAGYPNVSFMVNTMPKSATE